MERHLLRTKDGWLMIINGSYKNASKLAVNGSEIKTIPDHITDDDIWYGRVSFNDL